VLGANEVVVPIKGGEGGEAEAEAEAEDEPNRGELDGVEPNRVWVELKKC
jgi:hypothetical protein